MRTSEDARQSGLYASDCCDAELIFIQGDTFWRCPRCQRLCDWELLEATASPTNHRDQLSVISHPDTQRAR